MLIDLIKNSIDIIADDRRDEFEIYEEDDNSILNSKIIDDFLAGGAKKPSETKCYCNVHTNARLPSLTISIVNIPFSKDLNQLTKLVNKTSIKFKNTNISFSVKNNKPIIVLTASFFFFEDIENLLFKNRGYMTYDNNDKASKYADFKIASICRSMIISLLEASIFIDEISIQMADELMKKENKNDE